MGRRRTHVTGSALTGTAATPSTVPVTSIAHNPRNPRDHYRDVDELVASIREVGVLQPLGIVRYETFLTHFPEHEQEVGVADWVVLQGNRRLAAARHAGLDEVPVHVLDRLGRGDYLDESVLIENIQRTALPPLREAQAIRMLVERHGTQTEVAKRIGKTGAFVSQRLSLLKLAPTLQDALTAGDLLVEQARALSKLPLDEQVQAWRSQRASTTLTAAGETAAATEEPALNGVKTPTPARPLDNDDKQRKRATIRIGTPEEIVDQLRRRLTEDELAALISLLNPTKATKAR